MEENKNLQPDPELSPEDRLDQLLNQFLAQPDLEEPAPSGEYETPDFLMDVSDSVLPDKQMPEAEDAALPAGQEEPIAEAGISDAPVDEAVEPEIRAEAEPQPTSAGEDPAPEAAEIVALDDTWIGEMLETPIVTEEIGADEQAVAAAGLIHPEDQECEDIIQEVHDAEASSDEAPAQTEEDAPVDIIATLSPEQAPAAEASPPEQHTQNEEPKEMAENIPAEPIAEVAPAEENAYIPPRKIRPRKKGTYGLFSIPHMAATVIWLAIIVFIGVGLGNILWLYAADMLAFGKQASIVTITITDQDDLDDVAEKLQSTGLIKYMGLFKLYANLSDAMEDINPGTYKLSTVYDYNALVDAMSGYSSRVTVDVVIPEGYTCAQMFQLLERHGVSTVDKLEEAAANAEFGDYWFLEGVERGTADCLEGYLFPDTYTFYLNHDATEVLKKLLSNFNKRFSDAMKDELVILNETLSEMMRKNGLNEEYIAQHQMTIRDVVIVASMIEKETASTTEGYTVASVIYNRLTNPNAYPHLQIDATLVYVTGHSILTSEDLDLDSPYNTYKYPGLIPGPISNPSLASLAAALQPDSTTYYYYALNPATGVHKFSETLEEHEAFLDSLKKDDEESE